MNKTPQVRFSGFCSDWLSKSFADAFSVLPNNTLSRADLNDEEGSVKNVHYGDVLIKFSSVLDVSKELVPYISSDELAEKLKNAVLQNGDVVIADTAEDATVGKCTEMGGIDSDMVVSGLHTIPVRPLVGFSAGYLGYYMNTDAFHNQLLPLMQGTKVSSISKSALNETSLRFPDELTEQSKIAELFLELDRSILYQQQKCDKLIALKAACLDKMFPQNGSKVPEMRFAGFTGDWKQRKLGDLLSFRNGFNGSSSAFGSGTPLISVLDILDSGFITHDSIRGRARLKEDERKRYSVDYGDVLFQRSSENFDDAGTSNVYLDHEKPASFGGFVIRGKKKADYNPIFFRYLLDSSPVREQITHRAQGAQHINVSQNTLSDVIVYMPDAEEQKLIGSTVSKLDNLIALHQRKLEKLRQFKEAMLHKMFV